MGWLVYGRRRRRRLRRRRRRNKTVSIYAKENRRGVDARSSLYLVFLWGGWFMGGGGGGGIKL
jgi:hypothetical protein